MKIGYSSLLISVVGETYWSILQADPILNKYVPSNPLITYRRSQNLRDMLVHSYHQGVTTTNIFGSKGPKPGCSPCGGCISCKNMESATQFKSSDGKWNFDICHRITCETVGIIYRATCPCGIQYIAMTLRKFKLPVREHILDIKIAKTDPSEGLLKTLPKHFLEHHDGDETLLSVKGIDKVYDKEEIGKNVWLNWRLNGFYD